MYELRTSLHIQGSKEINGEVLPVILNTIQQQSNHSGRPLKLELGKPTIMQDTMTLMLVATRPLFRLNFPTSPASIYVALLLCRWERLRGQRMRVPLGGKVGETPGALPK